MRRPAIIFIVLLLCFLGFAVNLVWTLLTLLFVDGHEDAITKAELPAPDSSRVMEAPRLIPRILHQTYQNNSIPLVWQEAQKSCIAMHRPEDGWEYILWTDEKMNAFIEKEYPWFYDTFMNYPYPIMRADAIRYFVLAHFGGVYLDLDDGCNRELEPLLSYPAWVRKTVPTGISNDVMGARPAHPFFRRVIEDLQRYNRNWVLPYITVMASTGPLFLSIIWRHYSAEGFNEGDNRIRILWTGEYQGRPWSFFTHHLGNSWHGGDSQLIFWLSRHWFLVTIAGFTVGGSLIFGIWWIYHRFVLHESAMSADIVPKWKTASIRAKFPFWKSKRAQKEYELVSRHEV